MNDQEIHDSDGPIQTKILEAHQLLTRWGDTLHEDRKVRKLLNTVERCVMASHAVMNEVGVIEACRQCDEEEGGSCCGVGIENKYTTTLLLINLLLGVEMPQERQWGNSCYFLGGCGCSLRVRHVICVNYLCTRLQKTTPLPDLVRLQTAIGTELDLVFLLHETIKKLMPDVW